MLRRVCGLAGNHSQTPGRGDLGPPSPQTAFYRPECPCEAPSPRSDSLCDPWRWSGPAQLVDFLNIFCFLGESGRPLAAWRPAETLKSLALHLFKGSPGRPGPHRPAKRRSRRSFEKRRKLALTTAKVSRASRARAKQYQPQTCDALDPRQACFPGGGRGRGNTRDHRLGASFGAVQVPGQGNWCAPKFLKYGFLTGRRSSIFFGGVWAAPGGRKTLQKGGELRPPPFWSGSRPPGAAPTPKIDDLPSVKKII